MTAIWGLKGLLAIAATLVFAGAYAALLSPDPDPDFDREDEGRRSESPIQILAMLIAVGVALTLLACTSPPEDRRESLALTSWPAAMDEFSWVEGDNRTDGRSSFVLHPPF